MTAAKKVATKTTKSTQHSKVSKPVPQKSGNNLDLSAALQSKKWKKVKLKGQVISEELNGFEGLIGLEVLEDYDTAMVETGKPKMTRKQQKMERKKLARKLKATQKAAAAEEEEKNMQDDEDEMEADSNDDDEDDTTEESANSSSDGEEKPDESFLKKKRKLKKKETPSKEKLDVKDTKRAKILERREKRKKERKQRKQEIQKLKQDQSEEEEYPPERFALLRPPPQSDDEDHEVINGEGADDDDEVPKLVASTNTSTTKKRPSNQPLSVDELEGWNGLGVPQPILQALAEKGFKSPTEIQALTLPAAIMGKKDILGAAETGSGKTLAFGIPILAGIMELKSRNVSSGIRKAAKKQPSEEVEGEQSEAVESLPQPMDADSSENDDDDSENESLAVNDKSPRRPLYAIILTPTRELAVQIKEHLQAAAKYVDVNIAAIFGGLSVAKQERVLRKCPEIVVATPGRLWELYQQETPHLSRLHDISFLVIDEADRMVEKDHFEELHTMLKILNADELKKSTRQNFVFSATLTLVHDLPEHMQKRNLGKRQRYFKQTPGMKIQNIIDELGISQPKVVDITTAQQTAQNLTECRLICPIDHKDYYLYYFLQRHPGRTIVFCNSIDCVKRLATLFNLLQCSALPLHANMIQKQRLKNLERFRDNSRGLLIATDVAARGLDIPNVEHVIHYQVPRTSENYVHRSGRTARANKNGITVMLMEPGEVQSYVKLYKTLEMTEDLPLFPIAERYLQAVKQRVNLARDVDVEELKLRRTQTELGWMKKHAEDMDLIIDGYNDDSGNDENADEDAFVIERRRNRMRLNTVRNELKTLLAKPIFPKGFSFKYPTSTGELKLPDIVGGPNNDANDIDVDGEASGTSAVHVMKEAIEDMKQAKKMRNKKRKLA